eukprot:618429-Pyramimonas_sp.AAC.1
MSRVPWESQGCRGQEERRADVLCVLGTAILRCKNEYNGDVVSIQFFLNHVEDASENAAS